MFTEPDAGARVLVFSTVVLLETSQTDRYHEDSPSSLLQLSVVFRVKAQLHCLTSAVVVHDGIVQLDT